MPPENQTALSLSCLACPDHQILPDPDPYDWFCDDDQAVVCPLVLNRNQSQASLYASDRQAFRVVVGSCRPYNLSKEAVRPDWCPKGVAGNPVPD